MNSIELARQIRLDVIEMCHLSHESHIGSALSIADIVAVLYSDVLKYNIKNPKDDKRDRFILSKGHACTAVYSALAHIGFFDIKELQTFAQNNSKLSGHISHKVPGMEVSTGSLGHGVCIAAGMAYSGKKDKKQHKVFVLMGDGECDEGSVWETALFAAHHKLNNLTIIVDRNNIQALGYCKDIINTKSLKEKFDAFGFECVEIDGHNHAELRKALQFTSKDKPYIIIANTIKGKGVSFMEDNLVWHYRDPQGDDYNNAINELGGEK